MSFNEKTPAFGISLSKALHVRADCLPATAWPVYRQAGFVAIKYFYNHSYSNSLQ
jgi:hypothetical protein